MLSGIVPVNNNVKFHEINLILYHYTDQSGFIGIIENREFWATKIQYLNDENEYKLAIQLSKEYLEELINGTKVKITIEKFKYYIDQIKSVSDMHVCVCSLSEEGDLLSQWRGYSQKLGGYSIGFNASALEFEANKMGFKLMKCIYDPAEQKRVISELIDNELEKYKKKDSYDFEYCDNIDFFLEQLAMLSPIIKDSNFKEEAEWRLVAGVSFGDLNFRPGASMITPYCKISLGTNMSNLLNNVIIGHTPHTSLAVKATQAFLTNQHPPLDDDFTCKFKVSVSSIPFRNW